MTVRKFHRLFGKIIAVFLFWMITWGVILANRENIREIFHHWGNYKHPKYSLDFPQDSISIDEALSLGWETLGGKEQFKRIELKWEGGAPIYRIRFRDKHESEVTIHAISGEILIHPTRKKELKKIAQDFHTLSFFFPKFKWVLDALAIIVILVVISGISLFLKKKRISGKLTRKIHIFSSLIASIPFLTTATSGILINHEERLEELTKKYVSSSPREMPPLNFKYDSLPVIPQKAIEIFQNQFSRPKILRRVMLEYEHEYEALIWEVEPEEGMRNPTIIDAYTAEIIKSSRQIYLAEFLDQIHEWYLFGYFSKYVINSLALLLLVSLITGWLL